VTEPSEGKAKGSKPYGQHPKRKESFWVKPRVEAPGGPKTLEDAVEVAQFLDGSLSRG
jgi:hypothetical protein